MVTSVEQQPLLKARDAVARHAWAEAFDFFDRADALEALEAEDLESMAEAAWWTGRHDDCIHANERAFAAYDQSGNTRKAGKVAFVLQEKHEQRQAMSVAAGWRKRAERLLAEEDDCPEKGYLDLSSAVTFYSEAKFDEAIARLAAVLEVGMRFGDRDLQALTLMWQGKAHLLKGQVDEGMSLMEEATAAAVGGELSPMATGVIYCMMIVVCGQLADYGRAGEWTEAAERWCQRQAISGFPGYCRVHRAEIMRLRGAWEEAELEARRAHEELRNFNVSIAGDALYQVGEIRLRMGDFEGAEEAFGQAHELGHNGQPGMALLMLERGEADTAADLIVGALEGEGSGLWRTGLLTPQVEIAVARGDLDTARAGAAELEQIAENYRTKALEAMAAMARGQVLLAEGDAPPACRSLHTAWALWKAVDAPFEAARARRFMAEAMLAKGDVTTGLLELRASRAAFDKLGAIPEAERCRRLLRAHADDGARDRPRRSLVTFMFTDIVSSTGLIEAIGDEAWHDLRRWHDQALRTLFADHRGQEVDHAGDGFLVCFEDSRDAVRCAIAIQRKLAEHRRREGFAPQVRIGLHAAEATQVDRSYTGKAVHEAARIGALARGGEVMASVGTVEAAGAGIETGEPRSVQLKGIAESVLVTSIDWS